MEDLLVKVVTTFAGAMVKFENLKHKTLIFFTVGLLLGLLFAWVIWPADFKNATPGHLRIDFQSNYLAWVAEEYGTTGNLNAVENTLGLEVKENPWVKSPKTFEQAILETAAKYPERAPVLAQMQQALLAPEEGEAQPATEGKRNPLITILLWLFIVLATVGLGFIIIKRFTASKAGPAPKGTSSAIPGVGTMQEAPVEVIEGEEPPLKSFTTTYVLGDDFYDPSFSIEMGPDFLGECGIGVSETIGAGDPKKVTALEVWLFDKSDIRTVTSVLASEYAERDPDLQAKLAPKQTEGEIELIREGLEVTLETTALRVRAKIKMVEYAEGNLPPNSYFQRVSVELRAWVKSTGEEDTL
ncbi:MAG: hypothetical protein JW981_06620 [Anaerolineae bacterium]|nr:hypothetical protein [Anaerolineae bacterium]